MESLDTDLQDKRTCPLRHYLDKNQRSAKYVEAMSDITLDDTSKNGRGNGIETASELGAAEEVKPEDPFRRQPRSAISDNPKILWYICSDESHDK